MNFFQMRPREFLHAKHGAESRNYGAIRAKDMEHNLTLKPLNPHIAMGLHPALVIPHTH